MKFMDEYRQPALIQRNLAELRQAITRRWVIMDVCGGQTHSLLRHGLEAALEDVLELVHGPGCPVCVTPAEAIDAAAELARRPNVIVASFGDMLRVPGQRGSLLQARAEGAKIRIVYSPMDAVELAASQPDQQVVFFGVGFETTVPATALALLHARQRGLTNFSLLVSHVRVEPAMRAVMQSAETRVQGFLAAGHVCTVTGYENYHSFVAEFSVPVVVTGFEPLDLINGLFECVQSLEQGQPRLSNQYERSVSPTGNLHAQRLMEQVYEIVDTPWRGFGRIAGGGLAIRPEFREFDARVRFQLADAVCSSDVDCRSKEVMLGVIKPPECPLFGNRCTPETPVGAPMVSSEGACSAYYRYSRSNEVTS